MTIVKSYVYQWYLDDYKDSLRSTSGVWMTIGKIYGLPVVSVCLKMKSYVYQWFLDDCRDSQRSTSGIWMTIIKSKIYQWYLDDYR